MNTARARVEARGTRSTRRRHRRGTRNSCCSTFTTERDTWHTQHTTHAAHTATTATTADARRSTKTAVARGYDAESAAPACYHTHAMGRSESSASGTMRTDELGRRTGETERESLYSWLEAQRTAAQRRANGTRVGRIQTRYTLNLHTHRCSTQTRGPVCLTSGRPPASRGGITRHVEPRHAGQSSCRQVRS